MLKWKFGFSYHLLKFLYVLHVKLLLLPKFFIVAWIQLGSSLTLIVCIALNLLNWYLVLYWNYPQHRLSISHADPQAIAAGPFCHSINKSSLPVKSKRFLVDLRAHHLLIEKLEEEEEVVSYPAHVPVGAVCTSWKELACCSENFSTGFVCSFEKQADNTLQQKITLYSTRIVYKLTTFMIKFWLIFVSYVINFTQYRTSIGGMGQDKLGGPRGNVLKGPLLRIRTEARPQLTRC